ncbi:UPF0029-domain-containing protein [Hysterangium stoloniferum]|nr:UPF0029-domain-containing protein [Hysterangium stoloniferum]
MGLQSRPSSPLSHDHAERLSEFIQTLSAEREPVASELDVLCSIYGENAIRIWPHSESAGASATLRYEVDTNLPLYEDVHIQVLASLPPTYPLSSSPQLQLLSRFIGPFSVDRDLFGDVLKTFISVKSGIEFVPETVAVFDGLQHVMELCSVWYGEKLDKDKANKLTREEERQQRTGHATDDISSRIPENVSAPAPIPEGVDLIEAEAITDRKSVFIGRACRISHPSQVAGILSYLMTDRRIARAAHPVINAWRCTACIDIVIDNDDDGETAAGGRLAHLLQILDLDGVLVIVTRYFGGIHLGPDRFKHINQAARLALEKGHFLDGDVKTKGHPRSNGKKRY